MRDTEQIMQAEVLRIIEGGLTGDKTKVLNYARTLADNLEQSGDVRFAKRIRTTLAGKRFNIATLDGLSSKPVDQESRMEIVDVELVREALLALADEMDHLIIYRDEMFRGNDVAEAFYDYADRIRGALGVVVDG